MHVWVVITTLLCNVKIIMCFIQTVSEKNIQWDFHLQEKNEVQSEVKFIFILKAIQFATK